MCKKVTGTEDQKKKKTTVAHSVKGLAETKEQSCFIKSSKLGFQISFNFNDSLEICFLHAI